jgi:hypothetical protein
MKKITRLLTVGLALAFALGGCAGSSATNPAGTGSGAGEAMLAPNAPPGIDGVAGEFKGSVTDSVLGKGKADFQLSQVVGGQAGGSMQLTFGKGTTKVSSAVALDASSMKKIDGNAVALLTGTPPCTLAISAKFDRKTYTLNGSYKAFNNCAPGQKGSFSAKEQCYYVVAKPIGEDLQPRTFPKSC